MSNPQTNQESLQAIVEALQWLEPFKHLDAPDPLVLTPRSAWRAAEVVGDCPDPVRTPHDPIPSVSPSINERKESS